MHERETASMSPDPRPPHRVELDPPVSTDPRDESAAPPQMAPHRRIDASDIADDVARLLARTGADPTSPDARFVGDLITTALKLIPDGRDRGELKLITAAVKELRYAYRVFGQYPAPHKVTIFGSARTKPDHPDYAVAVEFGRAMAEAGWMVITGAGDGIMRAGHEGPGREASFGVAIRLPFETTANEVIAGDEKLIHFRYFFTRKLMFVSQAEAVALFPGGFGTLDEAFEVLTLVQTGKASMVPIVMLEGAGNRYWESWEQWISDNLLARGLISPEDMRLFTIVHTPKEAVEHITRFYRNYHSSRYVRDDLVIRLQRRLRDDDVRALEREFRVLIRQGGMTQRGPYDVEDDHPELPRLAFTHTRSRFGLVRALIDRINEFDPA